MPEISIIVPNYNTEKYLPRCLDSLIHQTFKDIEIILIDDGSKDASVQVMQKYAQKDKRIKVVTQDNAGPARARNQGLENASGKYLMFCDSDDWYAPNMCEVMYKTIEKEKVDVVCCHNFFDWEENLSIAEKEDRLAEKYYNPNQFGKHRLNDKYILSTNVLLWNKIWRRDLIEKYHIRFPDGHEHDDEAFWFMYGFVAKDIFYLGDKLYHYFLRTGSIMSTQFNKKPKNRMDRLVISDYVMQFMLHYKLQEEYTYAMAYIWGLELKNSSPFFSKKEQNENCHKVNQILHNQLKIKNSIIAENGEYIFLKNKCFLTLIYEWVLYRLALYFWRHRKNKKGRKHAHKYIRRIRRNRLCWKYLKGKNDD